jgi:hypothetical protein
MRQFVIEVGKADIEGSDGRHANNCMVYRAMKPVFPDLQSVGIQHAIFEQDGHEYFVTFPDNVQNLISDHYDGVNPPPFKFDIEVPDHLCDS